MPIVALLLLVAALQEPPRALSTLEREAGWVELFDGATLRGWHTIGQDGVRDGGGAWRVSDGWLHLPAGGKGGDLVTDGEWGDFELELEWRVAPGANSGVKYRVRETPGMGAMLGPEYQVLDDAGHPDGGGELTSAASLYALYAPAERTLRPAGEVNRTRIVAHGDRLEHWLNGVRVVECTVGSDDWEARRKRSKFLPFPEFARGRGRIGLQDHGDEVRFRSIRLRDLERLPGTLVELFDGETLDGWKALGDARWSVEDGSLLGEVGGGSQSFLVTERGFGDFLLEVELRNELPGNSGIQVRSHQNESGRVYGYQVEIDPSERAWSGGLYDEGRRAWLDDLSDSAPARAAFRSGEWNHYRIECLGPWIRTWVNGVPAADWLDPLDLEGFIGLQVHSGKGTRVRWRDFRLRDLGTRSWEVVDLNDPGPWIERGHLEADTPVERRGIGQASLEHDFAFVRVLFPDGEGAVHARLRLHPDHPQEPARLRQVHGLHARGSGLTRFSFLGRPGRSAERPLADVFVVAVGGRIRAYLDGEVSEGEHEGPPEGPARGPLEVDLAYGFQLHLESLKFLGPPR